jgi:hypothetical protein
MLHQIQSHLSLRDKNCNGYAPGCSDELAHGWGDGISDRRRSPAIHIGDCHWAEFVMEKLPVFEAVTNSGEIQEVHTMCEQSSRGGIPVAPEK